MPATLEIPVLIVGAGPVGLSLTLDLGWRGVNCVLVEADGRAVEHSKIGHIAVRTMEFFRRWGIAQAVREAGFPDDFRMSRVICTDVTQPPLHVEPHPASRVARHAGAGLRLREKAALSATYAAADIAAGTGALPQRQLPLRHASAGFRATGRSCARNDPR